MEEEQLSEAMQAKARSEEEAAKIRAAATEEFSDEDDTIKERKRDMAMAHAARDVMTGENLNRVEAQQHEREAQLQAQKMKIQMTEMRESEKMLRDDLRELQEALKDTLVAEWEKAKEEAQFHP